MVLWEILVPKTLSEHNMLSFDERVCPYSNREISLRHHRRWDKKVHDITGGLTIMRSVQGYWDDEEGGCVTERMIPVRVACNQAQIRAIAELTKNHYNQLKVMYYKVSDEVHFI